MTSIDRIFYFYTGVLGVVAGIILTVMPEAGDFVVKPYFWMLIAVAAFELLSYARGGAANRLTVEARLFGFIMGCLAMVIIPTLAGSPAKFF